MNIILVVVGTVVVNNKNQIFDIETTSTHWRRYLI